MGRPDTWMPMYWGDFWKDTGHLSEVEGWAYVNLIGAYWTNGGPLANDDARLQRQAKCSPKNWRAVKGTVTAFFVVTTDWLTHARIDKELAEAVKTYTARKAHIDAVNEKRRQNRPQSQPPVTAPVTGTQSQSHSPNGEKHPSDVLAAKAKRPTRIPSDWTPNPKDYAHATAKGLDSSTITAVAEQFRDHWTGASKNATSADWSAKWRTWIANHISYHGTGPWPRPSGQRSAGHVQGRASSATAFDQVRAQVGIEPRGGADSSLRAEGGARAEGDSLGTAGLGPVIDGDYSERSAGPTGGVESAYAPAGGSNCRGHDDANQSVPEADGGLPGGRGEARTDNSTEHEPVVAGVVRIEGSSGTTFVPPSHDGRSSDFPEMPAFLRRKA